MGRCQRNSDNHLKNHELNNKDNNQKKPNNNVFNPMWIYAIVGFLLIGFWFFSSSMATDSKRLDRGTFFEYLNQGYVKTVRLNLEENKVDVFLTDEALKLDEFKGFKDNSNMSAFAQAAPQYSFIVADNANFETEIENAIQENNLKTNYTNIPPDKFSSIFWNIIIWVLIFVAIWYFMFRRLGAAGGGPGGQIFNIGKSRAKLFDENDKVRVTFKDVA